MEAKNAGRQKCIVSTFEGAAKIPLLLVETCHIPRSCPREPILGSGNARKRRNQMIRTVNRDISGRCSAIEGVLKLRKRRRPKTIDQNVADRCRTGARGALRNLAIASVYQFTMWQSGAYFSVPEYRNNLMLQFYCTTF